MMRILFETEWNTLRKLIDQLEQQIDPHDPTIPTPMICQLLIAGEDHRFYRHAGVDPMALCRALWKSLFCGSRQGGSTIAMQLVRTITGRRERTLHRKIMEIILALRLTRHLDRDRLPIIYLTVAYYGWRMNSLKQAIQRLNIAPDFMNQLEAAKLVARLKYPEPRNASPSRMRTIERRAAHLIMLRNAFEKVKPRNLKGRDGTIQHRNAASRFN